MAGLQHHKRLHRLAPLLIRHPAAARVGDFGHGGKHRVDFGGVDVLAAGLDQLLGAAQQVAAPALVHRAEVAGAQPAVAQCGLTCLLVAPVAEHHRRAAQAQLAFLAGGEVIALGIEHRHRHMRQRPTDRAGRFEHVCVVNEGRKAADLGLAVAADHAGIPVLLDEFIDLRTAHPRAAGVIGERHHTIADRLHRLPRETDRREGAGGGAGLAMEQIEDRGIVVIAPCKH